MGFKHYLSPMDSDEVLEVERDVDDSRTVSQYEKSSSSATVPIEAKMVLYEPRKFDDVTVIARELINRKAAVVNIHRLQDGNAQRVVDFLNGALVALDGELQQIGRDLFLCTPNNVPVSGEIKLEKTKNYN